MSRVRHRREESANEREERTESASTLNERRVGERGLTREMYPAAFGHDDGGLREGLGVHLDHDEPAGTCGFSRRWPTATER